MLASLRTPDAFPGVWTLRNLFQTPSGASLVRLFIAHCSLGIAHFGMDLARLRSLQVDLLLDESIEPPQMLGSSLKSLRTRSDLAPTDLDINAQ
jgi:hypothetical protein